MKTTMKYSLYVLAGSVLLFAACNKEVSSDDNQNVIPSARVETLSVLTESDTKVDVNGSGAFSWTAGDQIAVWKGTTASSGSYAACTVENGTVTVPLEEGESRYNYAVYPAASKVDLSYSSSDLQVTLPASYDITDKSANYSPLPMIARQTAENTISFRTLTGLLRLNCIGVPNTTTTLTVNIGSNKITGTYAVANVPTSEHPDYTPSITKNDSGSTEIVYTVHATGTVGANVSLNVPLPLGSYTAGTITVVAKDASDRVLDTATKDYSAFTVTRNKGITSSVNFGTIVGLKFSTGNLYTDGTGALRVAADPLAHMSNYPTDLFTSENYNIANRTLFNWNEAKILLDGGTPTYLTSQTDQTSMSGKVIDGYYWTVPTQAEALSLVSTTRPGSTVNGTSGFSYAAVVVNLDKDVNVDDTYDNKGFSNETGTATSMNSDYQYGALLFSDNVSISMPAVDFSSAKNSAISPASITYDQLKTLMGSGCVFYPGSGYFVLYPTAEYRVVGTAGYWALSTEKDSEYYYDFIFRQHQTPYVTSVALEKKRYYLPVWLVRRYQVTTP